MLEPGGTIDAAGNFSIANLSAFDVDGGSVSGGALTTAQFLGRGPATLDFATGPEHVSRGKIDISTGVNLQVPVPKGWVLNVDGGSVHCLQQCKQ